MGMPTTLDLIREEGSRITSKACSLCGLYCLYAIRYPDDRGTALLCSCCDVPLESKQR